MPRKTITAEVDGQQRVIDADIPDDATPEEIEGAVREHLKSNPVQSSTQVNAPKSTKDYFKDTPQETGPISSFFHSALNQINPIPAIQRYISEGPPALQSMHDAERGDISEATNPEGNILGEVGAPAIRAAQQFPDDPAGAAGTLVGGYGPLVIPGATKYAPEIRAGGAGALIGGAKAAIHPGASIPLLAGDALGAGGHYGTGLIGTAIGGARILKGMYEGAQERLATLRGEPTPLTGQPVMKPPKITGYKSVPDEPTPRTVRAPSIKKSSYKTAGGEETRTLKPAPKVTGYKSTPDEPVSDKPTTRVVKPPKVTGYKSTPDIPETTTKGPSKSLTTPPKVKFKHPVEEGEEGVAPKEPIAISREESPGILKALVNHLPDQLSEAVGKAVREWEESKRDATIFSDKLKKSMNLGQ